MCVCMRVHYFRSSTRAPCASSCISTNCSDEARLQKLLPAWIQRMQFIHSYTHTHTHTSRCQSQHVLTQVREGCDHGDASSCNFTRLSSHCFLILKEPEDHTPSHITGLKAKYLEKGYSEHTHIRPTCVYSCVSKRPDASHLNIHILYQLFYPFSFFTANVNRASSCWSEDYKQEVLRGVSCSLSADATDSVAPYFSLRKHNLPF